MMKQKSDQTDVQVQQENDAEKHYSCRACGSTFGAKAPDDIHQSSSVYQCWNFDWIERQYKCPSCSQTTTLYWHSKVHKYRDYATAEQVAIRMGKEKDNVLSWTKRMAGY